MMLYLRGLIIGLLIFSWAIGYKFLSWDDNREFARNLAYATIRSAHIALCLLCYGWISKLALIDAVGAVLWGIFTGFFLLLIFSLCWISKEIDDEEADNNGQNGNAFKPVDYNNDYVKLDLTQEMLLGLHDKPVEVKEDQQI